MPPSRGGLRNRASLNGRFREHDGEAAIVLYPAPFMTLMALPFFRVTPGLVVPRDRPDRRGVAILDDGGALLSPAAAGSPFNDRR
jgi:hypothetical protein